MDTTTIAAGSDHLRLGSEQRAILEALLAHGHWSRGAGWVWSTLSRTQKLLESLMRHQLVERGQEQVGMKRTRSTVYRVTPAGVALVTKWRDERQRAKLAVLHPYCNQRHASGRICLKPVGHASSGESHEDAEGVTWGSPAGGAFKDGQRLPAEEVHTDERVKTYKVTNTPAGLVLTLNGWSFLLGDSAPSIAFELQQWLKALQ